MNGSDWVGAAAFTSNYRRTVHHPRQPEALRPRLAEADLGEIATRSGGDDPLSPQRASADVDDRGRCPPSELTVEHLLQQEGSLNDYPLPEVGEAGEAPSVTRSRLIHTVSNPTLLTQAPHSAISNGPFREKRGPIALNSALRLNARFQDQAKDSWAEDDTVSGVVHCSDKLSRSGSTH